MRRRSSTCNRSRRGRHEGFLCVKHASVQFGTISVCLCTVDRDIGIYALYFQIQFPDIPIYMQTGTGIRRRILNIDSMSQELGVNRCGALPALHAFTGNDYTSAFNGVGKVRAFRRMIISFLRLKKSAIPLFSTHRASQRLKNLFVPCIL